MHRALGRVPALLAALAMLCAGPGRAEPVRTAVLPSAEAAAEPLWVEAPPESGKLEPDLAPLVRRLESSGSGPARTGGGFGVPARAACRRSGEARWPTF